MEGRRVEKEGTPGTLRRRKALHVLCKCSHVAGEAGEA